MEGVGWMRRYEWYRAVEMFHRSGVCMGKVGTMLKEWLIELKDDLDTVSSGVQIDYAKHKIDEDIERVVAMIDSVSEALDNLGSALHELSLLLGKGVDDEEE